MPGGQWVAFEGLDTVHDCHSPIEQSPAESLHRKPGQSKTKSDESIYDNIDFPEVEIGGASGTATSTTSSSDSSRISQQRTSYQKETVRIPQPSIPPKSTVFRPWMVWLIVGVLVLYWFISHQR
jgi:hypothetical protein